MLSLIFLTLLLLLSLALGSKLLNLVRLRIDGFLERCLFSLGFGLAGLGYLVYFLGLAGFISRPVVWALFLLLATFLAREATYYLKEIWQRVSLSNLRLKRENLFIFIISGLIVSHIIFNLIGALAPETVFDAIWYHLALPKIYLANQRIFFVPYVTYAAFPRLMEMLYTFALAWQGDILAKLIHFSLGLLIVLAIYSLSRKFFSKEVSLLAGAIFYIMQPVNMLSATAYVDLGLTFYELLAVYALANWFYLKNSRWLLLAGLLTGFALSIKHQAIIFVFVVVISLILNCLFNSKERSVRGLIKNLFIYGLPALAIASPWYLDSYLHTGNPVYPFFNPLFGTGESYEKIMFAGTGKKSWYHGHSPWEFFTLLWNFTMGRYEGWLSPLLLFFLPLVFLVRRRSQIFKLSLLFGLLFYTAYFLIVPFYTVRYFLPIVPVFSIASAYIWEKISSYDAVLKRISAAMIILTFLINLGLVAFKNIPALPAAIGLESRDSYLSRVLVWYDVNRFIKQDLPRPAKILVNGAPLFYYFDFNYVYGSGPPAKSYREKAVKLKEQGFSHILLLVGAINHPEAARYFRLIYARDIPGAPRSNATRGARLYQIKTPP